jgi:transcriptional regulator with XRE-family HTH domain
LYVLGEMFEKAHLSAAVGRRINELREASGLSVDRLARQSGLRAIELRSIERGRGRPSLSTLAKLAAPLHVSVTDLVKTAANPPPPPAPKTIPSPTGLADVVSIGRAIAQLPDRVGDKLDAVEEAAVRHAMDVCGENQSHAARLLGIERKALARRWDKWVRRRGR